MCVCEFEAAEAQETFYNMKTVRLTVDQAIIGSEDASHRDPAPGRFEGRIEIVDGPMDLQAIEEDHRRLADSTITWRDLGEGVDLMEGDGSESFVCNSLKSGSR